MLRYEALMLTVPEITHDEIRNLETELTRVVQEGKGSVISFERWGKYRLSYPIKKHDYGVYFLARFEAANPQDMLTGLRTLFSVKIHDIVMRDMICSLDAKKSLAYQRPHSLEEAPPRDYSRDNRADGFGHQSDDDHDMRREV